MNAHYSHMQSLLSYRENGVRATVRDAFVRYFSLFKPFSIFLSFYIKKCAFGDHREKDRGNGTPKRVEERENVGERANDGVERSGRYSWG